MAPDQLSTTLAALADPTRRAILARLARGEASVTELAEPFDMSLPAVSKHLKVLQRAGLISRGREAQWRPCRLEGGPLRDVAAWLENYRALLGPKPRSPRPLSQEAPGRETPMPAATDASRFPDLTFTRVFDAPRELVFKVWTDPYHVAQWWGPHGFSIPVCKVDAAPAAASTSTCKRKTARSCPRSANSSRSCRRHASSSPAISRTATATG